MDQDKKKSSREQDSKASTQQKQPHRQNLQEIGKNVFDSMVNEFAHNAYVNKNDGLDIDLLVSSVNVTSFFFRVIQTATTTERMASATRLRVARKRRKLSSRAKLSTETTLRWATSSRRTKTRWI